MTDRRKNERNELVELAAIDALGLLSDKEQVNFEQAVDRASAEDQADVRAARESVMNEVVSSLPDVHPEPSLKHRVLGTVMQLIERDYSGSVQGSGWGRSADGFYPAVERDWVERIVAGRVSTFWRVAALVLGAISLSLLFTFIEAREANHDLRQIARGIESGDLFERRIGPETLDFILNHEAEHLAMFPVVEESSRRGMISFFPNSRQAMLLVSGLTDKDNEYRVYVRAEGVDQVMVSFTPAGGVTAIDFVIPNDVNVVDSTWWVSEITPDGTQSRVFESRS